MTVTADNTPTHTYIHCTNHAMNTHTVSSCCSPLSIRHSGNKQADMPISNSKKSY